MGLRTRKDSGLLKSIQPELISSLFLMPNLINKEMQHWLPDNVYLELAAILLFRPKWAWFSFQCEGSRSVKPTVFHLNQRQYIF